MRTDLDSLIKKLQKMRKKHGNIKVVNAECQGGAMTYIYECRSRVRKLQTRKKWNGKQWVNDPSQDKKVVVFTVSGSPISYIAQGETK
jgi:hypothetical protein